MIKSIASLLMISILSLGSRFAKVNQDTDFTEDQMQFITEMVAGITPTDIEDLDGASLYKQNCTACHGRKGGLGIGGATNLKKSNASLTLRVAMMYYGKGKMQSYESALKPSEMLSISQYLEQLRQ